MHRMNQCLDRILMKKNGFAQMALPKIRCDNHSCLCCCSRVNFRSPYVDYAGVGVLMASIDKFGY